MARPLTAARRLPASELSTWVVQAGTRSGVVTANEFVRCIKEAPTACYFGNSIRCLGVVGSASDEAQLILNVFVGSIACQIARVRANLQRL